ncbi:hypothetical protein HK104_008696 [Borealophlyctis nickersoniae]|nr:hypothetical protein HK104_008696 [Borealophlyctis nickersoniae]
MPDTGSFNTSLGGVGIVVNYQVHADHKAKASFSYLSRSYQFNFTKWSRTKFTDFQEKFHHVYNDTANFGSSTMDANGSVTISTTPAHQLNIVVQAIKDSFRYLDALLTVQQKAIIDYSCWYRERNGNTLSTYEEYIQLVTCHCIVHGEFLAPNVVWAVTPFVV